MDNKSKDASGDARATLPAASPEGETRQAQLILTPQDLLDSIRFTCPHCGGDFDPADTMNDDDIPANLDCGPMLAEGFIQMVAAAGAENYCEYGFNDAEGNLAVTVLVQLASGVTPAALNGDLLKQVAALKQQLRSLARVANRHLMEPDSETAAVLSRQVRGACTTLGITLTDLLDRGETR